MAYQTCKLEDEKRDEASLAEVCLFVESLIFPQEEHLQRTQSYAC